MTKRIAVTATGITMTLIFAALALYSQLGFPPNVETAFTAGASLESGPTPVVDPDTLESLDRPDNLVDRLIAGDSDTRSIGKGVCAAMLGNAVTLVQ